jgi:hypothetical protein
MPVVPVVSPETERVVLSGLRPTGKEHKIHWVQTRYILFLPIIGPSRLYIPEVLYLVGVIVAISE